MILIIIIIIIIIILHIILLLFSQHYLLKRARSQVKDLNGDEEDGLDETILPVDFAKAGVCC